MKIKFTAIIDIPDEVGKGSIDDVYEYIKQHIILDNPEIEYAEPWA